MTNRERAMASARAFFRPAGEPDLSKNLYRVRADVFVRAESAEDAEQIVCDMDAEKIETFWATVSVWGVKE